MRRRGRGVEADDNEILYVLSPLMDEDNEFDEGDTIEIGPSIGDLPLGIVYYLNILNKLNTRTRGVVL